MAAFSMLRRKYKYIKQQWLTINYKWNDHCSNGWQYRKFIQIVALLIGANHLPLHIWHSGDKINRCRLVHGANVRTTTAGKQNSSISSMNHELCILVGSFLWINLSVNMEHWLKRATDCSAAWFFVTASGHCFASWNTPKRILCQWPWIYRNDNSSLYQTV